VPVLVIVVSTPEHAVSGHPPKNIVIDGLARFCCHEKSYTLSSRAHARYNDFVKAK
jgi:hypothetical protein